jgi:hypothetical protein
VGFAPKQDVFGLNIVRMENLEKSLVEFLNPEIQASWGIPRSSLSPTSWNILVRALYKSDVIEPSGDLNVILLAHLSTLTVADIMDSKHVGNNRLRNLLGELSLIQVPAYNADEQSSDSAEHTQHTLEQWVIINILKRNSWKSEFFNNFGYDFSGDIFDDQLVGRKIRILELRMDGLTLQEIGSIFGVSRERIRQLLKSAYNLVQNDPVLQGKTFREFFQEKTLTAENERSKKTNEEREAIDSLVRSILNSRPGLTFEELARLTGKDEGDIRDSLHPQTIKFIWSERSENSNESPFTDEDILNALRLSATFESPISAPVYRDLVVRGLVNGPGPQTVAYRFGSWKKACEQAGVLFNEAVRSSYDYHWTENQMLEYIIAFLQNVSYGRGIQSYDQWRVELMNEAPSGALVRRKFETWIDTKNRALTYMRENEIKCGL